MKNELKEKPNNSSKCNDFYWTWTPGMTFEIVPIYEGLAYGKGIEKTEGIDPNVSFTVTGWNSATNNVSVYVGWKNGAATEPSIDATTAVNADSNINSGSGWQSTFPARGSVPCIIATDVTDSWTEERVDITDTDWWKSNFISSK